MKINVGFEVIGALRAALQAQCIGNHLIVSFEEVPSISWAAGRLSLIRNLFDALHKDRFK